MKVSIIIPVYKGNQYINGILRKIDNNIEFIQKEKMNIKIELLLINDYPEIPIDLSGNKEKSKIELKVLTNKKNLGIHQSRVKGITASSGDYILMLDQDDYITDNCIASQMKKIGKADIVIGNGYKMYGEQKKIIYRNEKKHLLATKEKTYLYAANQIVSPGHCLIKKASIPLEWMEHIITDNGADDMFLWLLLFEKKAVFAINREKIYRHNDTGVNLSLDLDKMYQSEDNLIDICHRLNIVPKEFINVYQRRIHFLRKLQTKSIIKKILACICNIDICLYKVYAYYR